MSLPGFSADASLSPSHWHHEASPLSGPSGAVVPQAPGPVIPAPPTGGGDPESWGQWACRKLCSGKWAACTAACKVTGASDGGGTHTGCASGCNDAFVKCFNDC